MEPKEKKTTEVVEKARGTENHKKIDFQLEEAAKKHHEAIKHQAEGNQDETSGCAVHINIYQTPATEAQIEALKHATFTS